MKVPSPRGSGAREVAAFVRSESHAAGSSLRDHADLGPEKIGLEQTITSRQNVRLRRRSSSLACMSRRKRYKRNLGRRLPEPSPRSEEWVRFEHEIQGFGVFSYLADARERGSSRLAARIDRLRVWFNQWLDAPSGSVKIDNEKFYFRAEASEHVERARRLADLVSRAGFPIRELRVIPHAKLVRWQDAHQLAVDTGKRWIEPHA